MSRFNPSLAYYAGIAGTPKPLPVAEIAPQSDSGRLTSYTVAVGDSGVGMDCAEIIQVTATGELSLLPDCCRLVVTVSSSKERVLDVKNSVKRRSDYVLQTLRNYQIKDIEVVQNLQRVSGVFHLKCEIIAKLHDLHKFQLISNLLAEKLDDSVQLSQPELSHSIQKLDKIRTDASLLAIKNCKSKAAELAKAVGANVGRVLAIREQGRSESGGSHGDVSHDSQLPMTMQQLIHRATITVLATVNVTFELQPKGKGLKS